MKYVLPTLVLLSSALFGVTVGFNFVINNGEVFMDGQKINFDQLPVVRDTPKYTIYKMRDENNKVRITRYKNGNGIEIHTHTKMTPEEEAEFMDKMNRMNKRLSGMNQKMNEHLAGLGQKIAQQVQDQMSDMQNMMRQQFMEMHRNFPFYK